MHPGPRRLLGDLETSCDGGIGELLDDPEIEGLSLVGGAAETRARLVDRRTEPLQRLFARGGGLDTARDQRVCSLLDEALQLLVRVGADLARAARREPEELPHAGADVAWLHAETSSCGTSGCSRSAGRGARGEDSGERVDVLA